VKYYILDFFIKKKNGTICLLSLIETTILVVASFGSCSDEL